MQGQEVLMLGAWGATLGYSPKINLERLGRETDPKEDLLGDKLYHSFFCGQGTRDPEGSSADNSTYDYHTPICSQQSLVCKSC